MSGRRFLRVLSQVAVLWLFGLMYTPSESTVDARSTESDRVLIKASLVSPFSVTKYPVKIATDSTASRFYMVNASATVWTSPHPLESWCMTTSPSETDSLFSVGTGNSGSYVAVGGMDGLYFSTNGGETWSVSTFIGAQYPGLVTAIAVSADASTVFCIAPFDGYLSMNGGVTFASVVSFAAGSHPMSLAMTSSGSHIAVGSSTEVIVSNDAGKTWSRAQGLPFGSLYYETIVRSSSHVIVGSRDATIYFSSDGGRSFTASSTAPEDGIHLLCASDNVQRVVAATMDGMYSSRDYGETWHEMGQLPSKYKGPAVEAMLCNGDATTALLVTFQGRILTFDISWGASSVKSTDPYVVE